jgi:hypothetical protein
MRKERKIQNFGGREENEAKSREGGEMCAGKGI